MLKSILYILVDNLFMNKLSALEIVSSKKGGSKNLIRLRSQLHILVFHQH